MNKFLKYLPSLPQYVFLFFSWRTLTNTSVESLGAAMVSQQLKWSTIFATFERIGKHALGKGGDNDRLVDIDIVELSTSYVYF